MMPKSFAILTAAGGLLLSINLPADDMTRGIAVAEQTYGQPSVADAADATTTAPNAWLCALGFLGFIVVRRIRSGPMA